MGSGIGSGIGIGIGFVVVVGTAATETAERGMMGGPSSVDVSRSRSDSDPLTLSSGPTLPATPRACNHRFLIVPFTASLRCCRRD